MDLMSLVARLSIDRSDYDAGINDAINDAESKGSSIGSSIAKGFGIGIKTIGAASTAVAGFGMAAVKTGESFDKSMAQVAATMGKTVDEIGELRDFAQEMGSTTAFSASQAADALNYMALAGYDAETSMKMLPNVLNLAAAGGIELATASDMITDAQSALGLTLDQTTEMVDKMAAASSKSNTSVAQLGEAFLTIGATARNMKGGTTELSTVLGVLADNGIKASEGGTHLRNALLSLQTPSSNGAIALAKIGMAYEDMYDSAGNMRALPEIFLEMQERMEGMDQASRDAIISGVFNKTDLAAVNALIGTSAERWSELEAAIDDSAGAAERMAGTQLDNLAGDVTLLQSAFEGFQIAISDELTPTFREFVQFGSDGLSRLTEAFKEGGLEGAMAVFGDLLSEGLTMIIDKLPVIVDAGMQLIGALGQGLIDNLPTLTSAAVNIITMLASYIVDALPAIVQAGFDIIIQLGTGIAEALPTLATELTKMIVNIATVLTDPANLTGILQAGVDIMLALIQGIIDSLPIIVDALPTVFDNLVNAIVDALPIIINGVTQLINMLATKLPEIVRKIGNKMPQIMRTVVNAITNALPILIQGVIALVQGLVQALPEIIRALVEALPQIISGVVSALIESLPLLIEGAIQLMMGLVQALPEIMQTLIEMLPEVINMVISALMENLPLLVEGMINMQVQLWSHLPEILATLIELIPEIFKNIVTALLTNVPVLLAGVVEIFGKITTTVSTAMTSIFTNIKTGIKTWWSGFKSDITGAFRLFIEDFKKWFDDLPYNLGVALGDMINKFVEWKDNVINWIKTEFPKIIFNITKWFIELPGNIKNLIDGVIDKFIDWAGDMIDMIKEEVPKIIDQIASFFEELPGKALQWGKDMVDSFGQGIKNNIDSALGSVKSFASGIKSRLGHSHPTEGELADDYTWMPDMMDLFAKGITDNSDKVYNAVEKAFNFEDTIISSSDSISGVTGASSGLITPTAGRDVTVILQLNEEQLGKTTFRLYNDENQRIGVDLGKAVIG